MNPPALSTTRLTMVQANSLRNLPGLSDLRLSDVTSHVTSASHSTLFLRFRHVANRINQGMKMRHTPKMKAGTSAPMLSENLSGACAENCGAIPPRMKTTPMIGATQEIALVRTKQCAI